MLSGLPVMYGINPYESEVASSTQLGAIGYSADGRKFRYCRNNATNAMVAGNLQQAAVQDTGDQDLAVAANAAIGATSVSLAAATVTANQYTNGYLVITTTPGQGLAYQIKSHPAATAATVVVTLYLPLKVALTTASKADFVVNPFDGVTISSASITAPVVGVAVTAVPVSYYSWIQSGGVGVVTADASGAVTVGVPLNASNQTAGCVEDADAIGQQVIGTAMAGIAQAEPGAAYLTID